MKDKDIVIKIVILCLFCLFCIISTGFAISEQTKYKKKLQTKQIEEKKASIMCYVMREGDTSIKCTECVIFDKDNALVITTTNHHLKVHPSRIKWKESQEQQLLKPYMGTKQ